MLFLHEFNLNAHDITQMTYNDTLRQSNAFAMFDGLKFGLYWCFGFLCTIKGLGNDALSTLGTLATFCAPILGCYIARRFEKQVRPDGAVGYGKGYLYSALLYFYATIILTIFAYIYFNWIDGGEFVSSYLVRHNSPEMQEALKISGMQEIFDEYIKQGGFKNIEQMLRSITPIDIAASLFNTNIMLGLILALPTALFAKSPRQKQHSENEKL